MKKTQSYKWWRHPHTTAEKRANQEGWERPSRRPHLLPDTYDDIYICKDTSWKHKRKKQYRIGGRGQHHSMRVEVYRNGFSWQDKSDIWKLEAYCDKYNVPYRTDTFRRFNWIQKGYWHPTGRTIEVTMGDFSYTKPETEWVRTGKYYRRYYIDHYIFNWWSDKDIGVEYIL